MSRSGERLKQVGRVIQNPYTSAFFGLTMMAGGSIDLVVNSMQIAGEVARRHPIPYTSAEINQAREAINTFRVAETELILTKEEQKIPELIQKKGVGRFLGITEEIAQIHERRNAELIIVADEQSRMGYDFTIFIGGVFLALSCGWRKQNGLDKLNARVRT